MMDRNVETGLHADKPTGWIKPQRRKTLQELRVQIAELRAALKGLEDEAAELEHEARLSAIAQARNIMRAHGISLNEVLAKT